MADFYAIGLQESYYPHSARGLLFQEDLSSDYYRHIFPSSLMAKFDVAIASTHRFNCPATMAIETLEATSNG
ncbi:hypothetical protein OUZ56_018896 [Daphnia magna]|uniref:Uncharacterized protein n=1 Tax=Daphnia magna TaxID=35525 RepID=A0ABQ9ZA53_9CRUS|nr:hypothetical protein OUZ56_018896 [Daphnia magna]